MSLLTKEQQEKLEKIRSARTSGGCDFEEYEDIEGTKDFERLFAIIDDLQARAPKQYTEQELNAVFESMPIADLFPPIQEEHIIGKVAWHSWKVCARFLGALKEEP